MTEMENKAVEYAVQQGVATLTMQSAPVNALSRAIRIGLIEGIESALNDASVKAIVVTSSLPIFSGGADISEFSGGDLSPMLPEVLDKIENANFTEPCISIIPVVICIAIMPRLQIYDYTIMNFLLIYLLLKIKVFEINYNFHYN